MDKRAANDAIIIVTIIKKETKWEKERIRAALEAVLEGYRLMEEAAAQRIKH